QALSITAVANMGRAASSFGTDGGLQALHGVQQQGAHLVKQKFGRQLKRRPPTVNGHDRKMPAQAYAYCNTVDFRAPVTEGACASQLFMIQPGLFQPLLYGVAHVRVQFPDALYDLAALLIA